MNKITDEVKGVLSQCKFESNKVFLPNIQLDRKLYVDVNKHLENSGGKWDRKQKCHVFDKGTEKLKEGISIGATVSEQQVYQSFFTPSWLAARVVEYANVSGKSVLEPSAGVGALAKECVYSQAKRLHCVELNVEYATELDENITKMKNSENKECSLSIVFGVDFLETDPKAYSPFDRVVMNPPFTKNQWLKHLFHAYEFLKPGGKLVSICPNSRENPKLVKFLEDKDYVIRAVENGAFKEEGTMVSVMVLEINKEE